jgi:hypothetical protein
MLAMICGMARDNLMTDQSRDIRIKKIAGWVTLGITVILSVLLLSEPKSPAHVFDPFVIISGTAIAILGIGAGRISRQLKQIIIEAFVMFAFSFFAYITYVWLRNTRLLVAEIVLVIMSLVRIAFLVRKLRRTGK